MPELKRADIETVLPYIKTRLADEAVLSNDQIFISIGSPVPLMGDQEILLIPLNENVAGEDREGMGQKIFRVKTTLEIKLRTRVELDEYGRYSTILTDSSIGHYKKCGDIKRALWQPWIPIDSSGNIYTYEPLKYVGSSQTSNLDLNSNQRNTTAQTSIYFEVPHILALTQFTRPL